MDRMECKTHEKALYYCPMCIKLICMSYESSHDHSTKAIDDYEPEGIKGGIDAKCKDMKKSIEKIEQFDKEYAELKKVPLYFAEKKDGTEFNPQLFLELSAAMSELTAQSMFIKSKRDVYETKVAPSVETFKSDVKQTEQLLSEFDETVKDSEKFMNIYRNKTACKEMNQADIDEIAGQIITKSKEYQASMSKIYLILEKYWFDGMPSKIMALKDVEKEIGENIAKISEIKKQQQMYAKSLEEANDKLEKFKKNVQTENNNCIELIKKIKEKKINEEVDAITKELAKSKVSRDVLIRENTELEKKNQKLKTENESLNEYEQRLQRSMAEKSKSLQVTNEEIKQKGKALRELLEQVNLTKQQLDSIILLADSALGSSNSKFVEMGNELENISSRHNDLKDEIENTKKILKEKKIEEGKMKERIKIHKEKLKEHNLAFTRSKLEIEDYLKSTTVEITKNTANAKSISKALEVLKKEKKKMDEWLKRMQTNMACTIIACQGMKREMLKCEKEVVTKEAQVKELNDKWNIAMTKLPQITALFTKYDTAVSEMMTKVQKFNEDFANNADSAQEKIKEFSGHIDKAREDYMKDKCGRCLAKTNHKLMLQCKHKLCEKCEIEIKPKYIKEEESFTLFCAVCGFSNSSILYPLRCGCSIELTEFDSFIKKIKEETRGKLCYYNSYELQVLQPKCPQGHEISDEELLSFYNEPINLPEARSSVKEMLQEDKKNSKREEIIAAIKGKTEAKIFNSKIKLGNDGVRFLADALTSLKNVEKMDLDANLVGDPGIQYLSIALPSLAPTLLILDLRRNLITDEGAQSLAKSLKYLVGLKEFYIASNKLGPKSGSYISEALKYMAQLKILHLSQNELGPVGSACIAEALAGNGTIETLYMSNTKMGDEGAISVGKALVMNKILKNLHLQSNSIGPEGLQGLAEGLKKNESLAYLDIRFNKIGQPGENICVEIEEAKQKKLKIVFY